MNKLSAKQKAFYKEVASILWNKWDPIGVNDGENDWDDEYDSYVPHVFRLAIENKDAVKIASHLSSSVIQNMGMSAARDHDLKIAELIIKAKQEALD
ncbi:hypothetical protein I6F65_21205 [Pseudoalteromonas sp. SWXJZ94C]|uniref:hypothetical protein n=1 Tax=Pseudoalteromonas sp. SWXJZ94C TaxID=2792065 RepID=UPI0018CF4FA2|nr:hypothetical protein [Pseudoalteromonas sp. SWXJZ94C]MBH0059454.1 hypothetical protein [Pseudoalteromonas sp. SWXJZ94C]